MPRVTSSARATGRRRARRTAFVPRLIFAASFVGVVPACVTGCTVDGIPQPDSGGTPGWVFDVAALAFDLQWSVANDFGVAALGFDMRMSEDAAPAPEKPDLRMGVADLGFSVASDLGRTPADLANKGG